MEKKIKQIYVGEELEFNCSTIFSDANDSSISSLIDALTQLQKDGATLLEFSGYTDSDHSVEGVTIKAYFNREETDAELKSRVDYELALRNLQFEKRVERDKAEYERLKKIFDK